MRTRVGCVCAAVVLGLASAAAAEIRTIQFGMPSDLSIWRSLWVADQALFNPFAGRIVESRLVLDYDSTGGGMAFHDAAELLFQIQLGTETVPIWNVTGADLGWSGSGHFVTTLVSHEFDGEELLSQGPFVLWATRIQSTNNDMRALGGLLSNSRWEFDVDVVPGPGAGMAVLAGMGVMVGRRRRGSGG